MLKWLAMLIWILTFGIMIWSLTQGQYQKALYQFFFGAASALMVRRQYELRLADKLSDKLADTSRSPES